LPISRLNVPRDRQKTFVMEAPGAFGLPHAGETFDNVPQKTTAAERGEAVAPVEGEQPILPDADEPPAVTRANGEYPGGETPKQICERMSGTDVAAAKQEICLRFQTDAIAMNVGGYPCSASSLSGFFARLRAAQQKAPAAPGRHFTEWGPYDLLVPEFVRFWGPNWAPFTEDHPEMTADQVQKRVSQIKKRHDLSVGVALAEWEHLPEPERQRRWSRRGWSRDGRRRPIPMRGVDPVTNETYTVIAHTGQGANEGGFTPGEDQTLCACVATYGPSFGARPAAGMTRSPEELARRWAELARASDKNAAQALQYYWRAQVRPPEDPAETLDAERQPDEAAERRPEPRPSALGTALGRALAARWELVARSGGAGLPRFEFLDPPLMIPLELARLNGDVRVWEAGLHGAYVHPGVQVAAGGATPQDVFVPHGGGVVLAPTADVFLYTGPGQMVIDNPGAIPIVVHFRVVACGGVGGTGPVRGPPEAQAAGHVTRHSSDDEPVRC
jgi:hypothetical protein